jgi:hypothetical protein
MLNSKHEIDGFGIKRWRNEQGLLHREDGPAVEDIRCYNNMITEYRAWFINGQCHRENGPAVEYTNGDKEWRLHGQLHRLDGPADERANGIKRWFIDGIFYKNYLEFCFDVISITLFHEKQHKNIYTI